MQRRAGWGMTAVLWLGLIVGGCSGSPPDVEAATARFADCLGRNGIEVQDLELTLNDDGSVGGISATIVSEGDVPYEPTVRLACTQEVELDLES